MRERERIHHRRRSKPPCHRRWSPNHHAVAVDFQSLLPILISNPRRSERPIAKIQSKPKPTYNLRERIRVSERERIHHRRCSKPPHHRCRSPIAVLWHDSGLLRRVLLGVRFHWENLFLLLLFLVKLFLLQRKFNLIFIIIFFWGNKNYFITVNSSFIYIYIYIFFFMDNFILLLVVFDGMRMLIK